MNGFLIAVLVFIVLFALIVLWMRATPPNMKWGRNKCCWCKSEVKPVLKSGSKSEVGSKVRIVYFSQNAILLCPHDEEAARRGDNLDVPLETEVERGETVEHALARLLCPLYPEKMPDVRFCLKHRSLCGGEDVDVYLFSVWCDEEEIPKSVCMNYKLWTCRQIEANMGKGLFSCAFEEEYPHLSMMIEYTSGRS